MLQKITLLALTWSLCLLTACGGSQEENASEKSSPVQSPDALVLQVIEEVNSGNALVVWQSMPASYQADVNRLAQQLAQKNDAEVYDRTFSTLAKLADVAEAKQGFILESYRVKLKGQSDLEELVSRMQRTLPAAVSLIKTITGSKIATLEGLSQFSGEQFFATTLSEVTQQIKTLAQLSEDAELVAALADMQRPKVEVLEASDTAAKISLQIGEGPAETVELTRVEGCWVPVELANQWPLAVANMESRLAAMTAESVAAQKPQIMAAFGMVDTLLNQFSAAETQVQFDRAVQGAMMPLISIFMMLQSAPQAPQAPTAPVAPVAP